MTDGRILSGTAGETCYIRLEGDLRFPLASRFEEFVRMVFLDERLNAIVVDMTAAEHMDSTMLGLLARVARYADGKERPRPVLWSTQVDINLLLDTMGFDAVFDIRYEEAVDVPPLTEIPDTEAAQRLPENVLAAHRVLMDMNDRNRQVFGATVDMLSRELKSSGDEVSD